MAINQQQQSFNRTNRSFIPLDQLPQQGAGQAGMYVTDVTGVLLGIEPRTGTYQVKDRRTGQIIERPNSYTAVFEDGSMFSWPLIQNQDGSYRLWDRFDQSINLMQVVQQRIAIHLWKDERGFNHLELAQQQTQAQQQMPVVNQVYAPQQGGMPWDMMQ